MQAEGVTRLSKQRLSQHFQLNLWIALVFSILAIERATRAGVETHSHLPEQMRYGKAKMCVC